MIGKVVGNDRYVHIDYIDGLPENERVLIRECMNMLPHDAQYNVVKIKGEYVAKKISFLWYPDFFDVAHPPLRHSYSVEPGRRLEKDRVRKHTYSDGSYILHRKELLISKNDPNFRAWNFLTSQEEKHGLLSKEHSSDIGRRTYWEALLEEKDITIEGHTLCI